MKIVALILLFLSAIGASAADKPVTRQEYIDKYAQIAMDEMIRAKVPASITLAQGCLESDNSNSRLATKGNNHFGVKCHSDWKGKTMTHDDDRDDECFRVYQHAEESYRDHSDFLTKGSRYASLFDLAPDDYKGWARGLRKAGYATDPKYPDKLITIIEEAGLDKYDKMVLKGEKLVPKLELADAKAEMPEKEKKPKREHWYSRSKKTAETAKAEKPSPAKPVASTASAAKAPAHAPAPKRKPENASPKVPALAGGDNFTFDSPVREVFENNRCRYIVVQKGDTYTSLAQEYALMEWQLQKFNDLDKDSALKVGQIIYLQAKKGAAERKYSAHTVKKGETVHQISQLYGIKESKLRTYNNLTANELTEGQMLRLRR